MNRFEAEWQAFLDQTFRQLKDEIPSSLAEPFWEAMRYTADLGGKRLRPRCLLAVSERIGLEASLAKPAAFALELLHTFTLIHDDLPCMDNDDTRRGKPSNHKKFGEPTALLAGDALSILCIQVFLRSPLAHRRPDRMVHATNAFLKAMRFVVTGQAAELHVGEDKRDLPYIQYLKTGILFELAWFLPPLLTGLSPQVCEMYRKWGRRLGNAYQALDDLIDDLQDQGSDKNQLTQHTKSDLFNHVHLELSRLQEEIKQHPSDDLMQIVDECLALLPHPSGAPEIPA